MKNKLNPKDYDFLWLVNNQTFFITSFWLTSEYLKRDFIITCKSKEFKTYIGKKTHRRLSQYGLIFLEEKFEEYRRKIQSNIKKANSYLNNLNYKKVYLLTIKDLRKEFLEIIKLSISLWRLYFFTEYFFYDEVQKRIEENPQKERNLFNQVKEMQKIKFQLRSVINQLHFRGNKIEEYLDEVKKRVCRNDLHYLHFQEIVDLLNGKEIIRFNRENYVLGKFNSWQPLINKEALEIIELFEKYHLPLVKPKELKGQVANPGLYIGRVKIIPFDLKKDLTEEIDKMNKDDVLVAGSTGPEMILACQKAGAIVTEEGGIISHAAIVSRELKIPCIIGTKIATQVFKDGDLVEVNANKGIVKKLYQ